MNENLRLLQGMSERGSATGFSRQSDAETVQSASSASETRGAQTALLREEAIFRVSGSPIATFGASQAGEHSLLPRMLGAPLVGEAAEGAGIRVTVARASAPELLKRLVRTAGSRERSDFSLYALRVIEPPRFEIPRADRSGLNLIPGAEVGSILYSDIKSADQASIDATLRELVSRAQKLEVEVVAVGHSNLRRIEIALGN